MSGIKKKGMLPIHTSIDADSLKQTKGILIEDLNEAIEAYLKQRSPIYSEYAALLQAYNRQDRYIDFLEIYTYVAAKYIQDNSANDYTKSTQAISQMLYDKTMLVYEEMQNEESKEELDEEKSDSSKWN